MQVEVFQGEMLVGTAVLEHLDPPMGVAFGPFSPSADYVSHAHANVIEGEYVGEKGLLLAATVDEHGTLAASIAIADWAAAEMGQELTLYFKDGGTFGALFADHPDYRA
jgi:hypothetical protein